MKQTDVDLILARAQVSLAFYFATAIFALLIVLILDHSNISPTVITIITSVITALVTVLTLQQNFFFARTRPAALPDPTTTSTTTTTTTTPTPTVVPEGSTLVAAPQPPAAIVPTASTTTGVPNAQTMPIRPAPGPAPSA